MVEIDDELLSAFMDGELSPVEAAAVAKLIETEPSWSERLNAFKADSQAIAKLPTRDLSDFLRNLTLGLAESNMEAGSERRRVPRFRRRWMLLACFVIPASLTLFFFQNPGSTSRLYFKKDRLELQARRSILEGEFQETKSWQSPRLWGKYHSEDRSALSFQVDSEEPNAQQVSAEVRYDFNGDGEVDRVEVYEASKLDLRKGWERFTPEMIDSQGEFRDLEAGQIIVVLRIEGDSEAVVKLSGTPGELVLPFRGLRGSKGADE